MYFLGEYLSSDMLSGMKLETCASKICEKCDNVTNTRTKLDYHQVSWLMSQEEWNRGKIPLKKLLKKGTLDTSPIRLPKFTHPRAEQIPEYYYRFPEGFKRHIHPRVLPCPDSHITQRGDISFQKFAH